MRVADAIRRLHAATTPAGLVVWNSKDFVAHVRDNGEFEIWRRGYAMRNLSPRLMGRIGQGAGGGSRIEARFGRGRWNEIVLKIWLVLATLGCAVVIVGWLAGRVRGQSVIEPPEVIIPLLMLALAWTLPRLGYFINADDEEAILTFVEGELSAHRDSSIG